MTLPSTRVLVILCSMLLLGSPVFAAQAAPVAGPSGNPASDGKTAERAQQDPGEDLTVNPAQPDFTIVGLPTALRLPKHRAAFRVTHRFLRPLGAGDFGDLIENFFGLDSGAFIGLEFRFGLRPGTQVGIHRTSGRTIQFFGQHDLVRQGGRSGVGLAAVATIEGLNNFREEYSPAVGLLVSRTVNERAGFYAMPTWVGNTNRGITFAERASTDEHTALVGLGARIRVGASVYLVGEIAPRLAGFDPGVHHAAFGLEKRVGGHIFQINVSDTFGTTMGQIARGGLRKEDWYIGFNISRKFY